MPIQVWVTTPGGIRKYFTNVLHLNDTGGFSVEDNGGATGVVTLGPGPVVPKEKRILLPSWDGSSAVLAPNLIGLIAPLGLVGTITSVSIEADVAGSAVVDIWKGTTPPLTVANSICASAKPTLSSAYYAVNTTLTGWTTAIAADDHWKFHIDSVSGGITFLSISIIIQPT